MMSPVEHWPSQVDHQQISTNSFPQMLWPIPTLTTCRISKDCCRPRSRMAPRAWLLLFAAMLPVIFGKVGEDNSANISDIYLDHNAYITLKKNRNKFSLSSPGLVSNSTSNWQTDDLEGGLKWPRRPVIEFMTPAAIFLQPVFWPWRPASYHGMFSFDLSLATLSLWFRLAPRPSSAITLEVGAH